MFAETLVNFKIFTLLNPTKPKLRIEFQPRRSKDENGLDFTTTLDSPVLVSFTRASIDQSSIKDVKYFQFLDLQIRHNQDVRRIGI